MNFLKFLLPAFALTFSPLVATLAQKPDTTTFRYSSSRRWHNVVITMRDKSIRTGYMHYYLPYAPEKTLYLIPVGGTKKQTEKIKRKYVESIDYAGMRYELIKPDSESEYLAREVSKGKLDLFVFTEFHTTPIPVPGLAVVSIPYDQSSFFLRKGTKVIKIERNIFRERIAQYVQDDPQLVEKLKTKEFKYKDIPAIITQYNTATVSQ